LRLDEKRLGELITRIILTTQIISGYKYARSIP
jgi:hypothetical protein